jgi:tagatose 1,6-diphosphate aldolase
MRTRVSAADVADPFRRSWHLAYHGRVQFHALDNPIDAELELVRPAAIWVEDMLRACRHPQAWNDPGAAWTRQQLMEFLSKCPEGVEYGDPFTGRWPGYYLWMRLRPEFSPVVPMAGTISFRLADNEQIRQYSGHIGYGVFPPARGHHYAERATRLVMPLARKHGMDHLWITCNPDNLASRRTCERLGAKLINIVDIPRGNLLYEKGERQKCRFRLDL